MGGIFKTADYEATLEQTVKLGDCLPPDHLARFIADVITQLDFTPLYRRYGPRRHPRLRGRPLRPAGHHAPGQMAALIVRAMGWDALNYGNPFPARGEIDADLWRNVGTLAYYGVARGYQDGTYRPTG